MISTKITLGRTAASLLPACFLAPLTLSTPAVADEGQVVVLWFGQSAFKITSVTGKVIMIAPFLTKNPKT